LTTLPPLPALTLSLTPAATITSGHPAPSPVGVREWSPRGDSNPLTYRLQIGCAAVAPLGRVRADRHRDTDAPRRAGMRPPTSIGTRAKQGQREHTRPGTAGGAGRERRESDTD